MNTIFDNEQETQQFWTTPEYITVTGYSSSRLYELVKNVYGTTLDKIYNTSTSSSVDGVDLSKTIINTNNINFVYYYQGITYEETVSSSGGTFNLNIDGGCCPSEISVDNSNNNIARFSFVRTYFDQNDFTNQPQIDLYALEKITTIPNVSNDINVDRLNISVVDKMFILSYFQTINQINSYAAGGFFKIINNS